MSVRDILSAALIAMATVMVAAPVGCMEPEPRYSLEPYDYKLAPKLIEGFYRDNPPDEVDIRAYYIPNDNSRDRPLSLDAETVSAMHAAMREDSEPVGTPRGYGAAGPVFILDFHGPATMLRVDLTGKGFALGTMCEYLFLNPTLSRLLGKACKEDKLYSRVSRDHGARIRYYLKIVADEDPGPVDFLIRLVPDDESVPGSALGEGCEK